MGESAGVDARQLPIHPMTERSSQSPVVVILKRDEAERLQYAVAQLSHGGENFSHPVNRPCLRLKGDFDEVTLSQTLCQLQQAAGHGNGLEFSFCAPAIF